MAGQTVLTAAHVVAGARSVWIRGPDKVKHLATVDPAFVGHPGEPGPDRAPDLALLTVPTLPEVERLPVAAVRRDSDDGEPVQHCQAVGYPEFAERPGPAGSIRDVQHALGHIPVLSQFVGGLLTLQVSSSPRDLPPVGQSLSGSPWSGMSGAPVLAEGHLVGVVTEHAPGAGSSAITLTPLTTLDHDTEHPGWGVGVPDPAAWWARLGAAPRDGTGLPRLPQRRARPSAPYRATIRDIHSRAGTLIGRDSELVAITEFALGPPGYRWLVGDAWAGKTTLLAEAVTTSLPAGVDVVAYFLSQREADADANRFLAAVIPQLAELLDEDRPELLDVHQFRDLWQRAADTATRTGRDLLLVVDGLDEDLRPPRTPSVTALLPTTATGRAHVLVSSRPHPKLPSDLPVPHPLHTTAPLTLEPFPGSAQLQALALHEIDYLKGRDLDDLALTVLGGDCPDSG